MNSFAKYCENPSKMHWTAVKRIMRYLKGTSSLGLMYHANEEDSCLTGYSDADWAGDIDDRKSTSGYIFEFAGGAISWRSKKQTCVALSTAEAEYMALANACQEAIWLKRMFESLMNTKRDTPVRIYEDNQSAICMSKNPQCHGRAKHINIKFHFVREQVNNEKIELVYCPTDLMKADMFTKNLNGPKFKELRSLIGMVEIDLV